MDAYVISCVVLLVLTGEYILERAGRGSTVDMGSWLDSYTYVERSAGEIHELREILVMSQVGNPHHVIVNANIPRNT